MNQHVNTSTNRVYERTVKGQAEVLRATCSDLDEQSRRFLLLVNGFTPLADLANLMSARIEMSCQVAEGLAEMGFVKDASQSDSLPRVKFMMGTHSEVTGESTPRATSP